MMDVDDTPDPGAPGTPALESWYPEEAATFAHAAGRKVVST